LSYSTCIPDLLARSLPAFTSFLSLFFFFFIIPRPPPSTLFPYTTLFRSLHAQIPLRFPLLPSLMFPHFSEEAHLSYPLLPSVPRSEEHTSELQSRFDLVCRLLLEKKKKITVYRSIHIDNYTR